MTSGQDEMYAEAVTAFAELESRRLPIRASDVELKVAAYMRNHGVRSAVLVINNIPCPGPYGSTHWCPFCFRPGTH